MKPLKYLAAYAFICGSAWFALSYNWAPATWCGVWSLLLLELADDT